MCIGEQHENCIHQKPFGLLLLCAVFSLVTPIVNFSSLPDTWENMPGLRRRVVKGRPLLVSTTPGCKQVLGNVKNLAANYEVLKPVLQCMAKSGVVDTPSVDVMGPLVLELFGNAGYPNPGAAEDMAHQEAWAIKRCLTLARRKWSRPGGPEIPKDPGFSKSGFSEIRASAVLE